MISQRATRRFDEVKATFAPRRTDDLPQGAERWIGRRLRWHAGWPIESGPYEGQWAWIARGRECPPFAWVPECDLADIEASTDRCMCGEKCWRVGGEPACSSITDPGRAEAPPRGGPISTHLRNVLARRARRYE